MEPGSSFLAEDEVGGTFNVALCVDLGAVIGEEGVLET
jgi:hypothetical protein